MIVLTLRRERDDVPLWPRPWTRIQLAHAFNVPDCNVVTVALRSCYTRAFDDGPRNFESWSSDVDDTSACTHPLLTTTPHQRKDVSALDRFDVHHCPTWRVFSAQNTAVDMMWKFGEESAISDVVLISRPCSKLLGPSPIDITLLYRV
ncbi:hypothetical protein TNCV_561151 [Trichonephila clavipes]|uniref:Uncharacterized protein n=1 Tax=Trichonephila clavipes TaxID=2585209 RepID=A0A8X6SDG7_TRICX|nr:hypothetical protein TNCV_561151 [Trichonephila clavipes]